MRRRLSLRSREYRLDISFGINAKAEYSASQDNRTTPRTLIDSSDQSAVPYLLTGH